MPRPVVLALLVLALAGCSTPEKSGSLPALSPGSSPSAPAGGTADPGIAGPRPTGASDPPSSVASAVVKPPEADRPDAAGAEAFARYWFDELNAAYNNMDPSPLAGISDATCRTCQNYISSISAAHARGSRYRGGQVVLRQVVAAPAEEGLQSVFVNLDASEGMEYDRTGRVVLDVPPERNTALELRAKHETMGWTVAEVVQIK